MSFNKIIIVGNLGRDPELKYTGQGTAMCKLSVATSEKRKNQQTGEMEEHTTWFKVTVWGRQAELANEYLAKGRKVYLEGRLHLEEYTDRDGNKRVSAEVNASDMQFIESRNQGGEASTPAQPSARAQGAGGSGSGQARTAKPPAQEEDDSIPF